MVSKEPFSEEYVKTLSGKKHFNNLKNLLWNGMVAWMLQVLNGTIHANKESLFVKVWVICYTESLVITADVWKIVQGRH